MPQVEQARATIEDLYREPGKAELINGRIVRLMATGHLPNQVAGRIYRRLADYADESGAGRAYTDNIGFAVRELVSGRESFAPDAAFYSGPLPENRMRFIVGTPTFAVEVRSENDYGPGAEADIAAKRADYFLAGTQVVWDVDPIAEEIRVYRSDSPEPDAVYRPGDAAEAEPAVPGWQVSVDWIFS
jgi:Uma2 family endonuclease